MSGSPSDKPKSGLSLFASLLDPSANSSNGTITRARVVFKQPAEDESKKQDAAAAEKAQLNAAALRFQPTKRPQQSAQKEKAQRLAQAQAKAAAVAAAIVSGVKKPAVVDHTPDPQPAPRTTVADWTNDADDDEYYADRSKRERGGRKKRKKNKQDGPVAQDWDDIYDPSRPNNYEEYRHSDERIREVQEWKDRLYAHRRAKRGSSYSDSDEDTRRPQVNSMFAPPPSFAPPAPIDSPPAPPAPPASPPPPMPSDQVVRKPQMDYAIHRQRTGLPALQVSPSAIPVQNSETTMQHNLSQLSTSNASQTGTISRAPVRYKLPEAPSELPKSEAELEEALQKEEEPTEPTEDAPRSSRPGQKGFAERLMSKYGWTKGTGLGADGSGIISALQVKVEKQKKRPDAEGGGVIGPAGRGRIIGGKRKEPENEGGKFGPMSEVIILRGMLNGMDLDFEMGEGNLVQEIGEECGEKYGRVERVYVDTTQSENTPVFVKFTAQLSALRAVNALEGRTFNGNIISARFFDADTFAKGVYM